MKLKFISVLFVLLLFSAAISAQKKKITFRSFNEAALLSGETKLGYAFQSVNGIQYVNWFLGPGVALDYYYYRTLPVFLDGKYFFGKKKVGFVYGDMGYNFPCGNKPGKEVFTYNTYHFTGGLYTGVGIGYIVTVGKKTSVVFSIGHSYKQLRAKVGRNICLGGDACSVDYNQYYYDYGRIILKAGLLF